MDRSQIRNLAHADHPVASPLDDETVDRLLRRALRGRRSVLDLGCGDGTWLLRALLQDGMLRAVGVDISGEGFDHVQEQAQEAGLAAQLKLHHGDAKDWVSQESFDVVMNIGSTYAFGGLLPSLNEARKHLAPGGLVVIGECFWERPPSEEVLTRMDASLDDYQDLTATMDDVIADGWLPLQGHVSTLQEWDNYHWSWTGSLAQWAVDHPDHADTLEVLDTAAAFRQVWLRGFREILGFVTLLLTSPPA